MGGKKAELVRLVSAAGTGFFYVVKKNKGGSKKGKKGESLNKKTKGQQNEKSKVSPLEFRKYDPRVNCHVLFTEAKMK